MDYLDDQPCPCCYARTLVFDPRYALSRTGSFVMDGERMPFTAVTEIWIRCTSCGTEAKAHD